MRVLVCVLLQLTNTETVITTRDHRSHTYRLCVVPGHRTAAGAVTGPRHQILRRASTSNLIASRIAPSPTPTPTTAQQQPMSPRRMSAAAPASTAHSQGFVKGSSPGAGGGFSKGPSPARSASPTPAGFAKGPSPMRCASPTPGSNGVRRLPSPSPSHSSLRESRESRESSVGRSSSTSGGGLSRPSSPSLGQPLRQSYDQQQQQQRGHQQMQPPQHQAVQRCKSPSPAPGSRCVSPALSGNRTLPRPLSRGASGIPRPMSPALTPAPSSSSSTSASSAANPARRQLFSMARWVMFLLFVGWFVCVFCTERENGDRGGSGWGVIVGGGEGTGRTVGGGEGGGSWEGRMIHCVFGVCGLSCVCVLFFA